MWLFQKVKASALQYVLVVSVLIAIIVFAFISLVYLQQKLQVKNSFYKETIQNVQFGFDYSSTNEIAYNQIQEHQFSENELENTILLKQHWGIFDVLSVTSNVKNETFIKTGILGAHNPKRDALYLKENNKPLVLVGDTKIVGNVSLPKLGVKRGNISGTSYNGNQLIYGNQNLNSSSMPTIKNMESLKGIFQQNFRNDSIQYFELEERLNKTQSYTKSIAFHFSNGSISLRNINLKGNIIIQSNSSITVDKSSVLEDIILIAPKVEISSGVEGNFQVFASKKITVQKKCKLKYPSALVLIDNDKIDSHSKENNAIFIDENTNVKGVVMYQNESKENTSNFNSQLILSKNATVTGEIYCNQNLEILGSVFGSVYTNNFITKQFGSTYVNHIYNGVINSKKLPKQYCGLSIDNSSLKVAKWVY